MEKRKAYCPNCDNDTEQVLDYFNPDKPDDGLLWVCQNCFEGIALE